MQLNNQGCVCDVVKSFQLETGESQDLCGPWSVGALKYAGLPGKGAAGTAEQVDVFADSEADKWLSGGHTGALGSTIEDMHQFFHDAGLHYWDIANPTVDNIRAAVKAGYPVLITANEQNIIEKKTGQIPYPWAKNNPQFQANHILPITGIDKDGDFISPDSLNNNYQGYWPVVYLASKIAPSWASVVQLVGPDAANPWLKPIPGDTPTSWPQGFDAQNFEVKPQVDVYKLQAFEQEWVSIVPGLSTTTGIAKLAYEAYWTPEFHGPATSHEFQLTMSDGSIKVAQTMLMGVYLWDLTTSTGKYYPYH